MRDSSAAVQYDAREALGAAKEAADCANEDFVACVKLGGRGANAARDALQEISEVRILFPTQANAVFADLPPYVIVALRQAGWKFYTFIGQGGCRLMCAWDTTEEDVDLFVSDLKRLLREAPKDVPPQTADHRKL